MSCNMYVCQKLHNEFVRSFCRVCVELCADLEAKIRLATTQQSSSKLITKSA